MSNSYGCPLRAAAHELTIGGRAFTPLLPTTPDNPMLPDNF